MLKIVDTVIEWSTAKLADGVMVSRKEAVVVGGIPMIGGRFQDELGSNADRGGEYGACPGDEFVRSAPFEKLAVVEPRAIVAPKTNRRRARARGIGRLEVARDGECATRRGSYDGNELAGLCSLQEGGVEGVVEEIVVGVAAALAVVVDHYRLQPEAAEESSEAV